MSAKAEFIFDSLLLRNVLELIYALPVSKPGAADGACSKFNATYYQGQLRDMARAAYVRRAYRPCRLTGEVRFPFVYRAFNLFSYNDVSISVIEVNVRHIYNKATFSLYYIYTEKLQRR